MKMSEWIRRLDDPTPVVTAAEWVEQSVAEAKKITDTYEDPARGALFLALHRQKVEGIANCIDHDMSGPMANGIVYASCSKCDFKRKITITEWPT